MLVQVFAITGIVIAVVKFVHWHNFLDVEQKKRLPVVAASTQRKL
jgi:hypothetical protein